jgi:SSS family transporter
MRIFTLTFVCSLIVSVNAGTESQSRIELSEYRMTNQSYPVGYAMWASPDGLLVLGGLDGDQRAHTVIESLELDGTGETRIQKIGDLDRARAWAAVVADGDSCILIGGTDGESLLRSVVRLDWVEGVIVELALPDLEIGLAMAGADLIGRNLYIVGGTNAWPEWESSNRAFRLSLDHIEAGWSELEKWTGDGIILPSVVAQFGEVHVFGGWKQVIKDGEEARWIASDEAWGYREFPVDGTTRRGWRSLGSLPIPLAGAASFGSGQSHVVVAGGVSGSRAEPAASGSIYTFHNLTETWISLAEVEVAPGVASAVASETGHLVYPVTGVLGTRGSPSMIELRLDTLEIGLRTIDYGVVIIYFFAMASIGWYFARKQDSSEEYALGSRNVRWWAAGISMFATGASSISFMAIPAIAFSSNLVFLTPTLIVVPVFFFIHGWIIFPLLRRLTLTSTYEYLQIRFNGPLRLLASLQCVTFQVLGRMSVVLLLPSLAISAVTGLDVITSVIVMGVLTTIYTTLGGFEAVIWTDVTQGLLMMLGMLMMIVLAIAGLPGGFGEFLSIGRELNKFDAAIFDLNLATPIIYVFILAVAFQNVSAIGDQPVVQRVFATPEKDMKKLAGMSQLCAFVIASISITTGIAIFAYFRVRPELLDPTMSNDQVVPLYVVQRLPVGISGLIVAALFAASMSTLSSSMNSVATLVNRDFVTPLVPKMSDRSQLLLMKLISLSAGMIGTGIAVFMATLNITSMFETWNQVVALLGGGFVGMYILGMFTHKANSVGAIVGALASVLVTYLTKEYTSVHYIFLVPVAISTCVIIGYIASVLTPGYSKADLSGLTVWDVEKT